MKLRYLEKNGEKVLQFGEWHSLNCRLEWFDVETVKEEKKKVKKWKFVYQTKLHKDCLYITNEFYTSKDKAEEYYSTDYIILDKIPESEKEFEE